VSLFKFFFSTEIIVDSSSTGYFIVVDNELFGSNTGLVRYSDYIWGKPDANFSRVEEDASRVDVMIATAPFKVSRETGNPGPSLHTFGKIAGMLGTGLLTDSISSCFNGGRCTSFERFLAYNGSYMKPSGPLIATINLESMKLELGGSLFPSEDIIWSEKAPNKSRDYFVFPVFQLQACGVPLFGDYTRSWSAIIDTGASCLGLPKDFFEILIKRIPVTCQRSREGYAGGCFLNEGVTGSLPLLTFRVSDSGDLLSLSLDDLILPGSDRRICIVSSGPPFADDSKFADFTKTISLGTMALKSLQTVLNFETAQVGFVQTRVYTTSFMNCLERPECKPWQVYHPDLNACRNYDCDSFLFFSFDETTNTCRVQFIARIGLGIVIASLVILEVVVFKLQMLWTSKCMEEFGARN
jgi:hypothetical protein